MTDRTIALISNPAAGRGGADRAREVRQFLDRLEAHGIQTELLNTAGPRDAARLAEQAVQRGVREIVVSGGDGTINEALQGLVGAEVKLGIWPRGTANVLARELSLPFGAEAAAEVIVRGRTRRIHVGRARLESTGETRYFLLMAGIGLDASVVSRVRPWLKRRVGEAAFWYAGLSHLAGWQLTPFSLEVDGRSFEATMAAIGKSAHYGGNLSVTPRARLDAPEFEVCVVNSRSRLRYLYLLSQTMRGGVAAGSGGVRFIRTSRARATGNALVQVDGELLGRLPATFEIHHSSIPVLVP